MVLRVKHCLILSQLRQNLDKKDKKKKKKKDKKKKADKERRKEKKHKRRSSSSSSSEEEEKKHRYVWSALNECTVSNNIIPRAMARAV